MRRVSFNKYPIDRIIDNNRYPMLGRRVIPKKSRVVKEKKNAK
jgi:hypothetical protein